jgi:hypothetical protein
MTSYFFLRFMFCERTSRPFARGVGAASGSERGRLQICEWTNHYIQAGGKWALTAFTADAQSESSLLDLFIGSITKRCENCASFNEFQMRNAIAG